MCKDNSYNKSTSIYSHSYSLILQNDQGSCISQVTVDVNIIMITSMELTSDYERLATCGYGPTAARKTSSCGPATINEIAYNVARDTSERCAPSR